MSAIRQTSTFTVLRHAPSAPAPKKNAATAPKAPAGWSAGSGSARVQARRLETYLRSPEGKALATRIIHDAVKKNALGKNLKIESGVVTRVRPEPSGTSFVVDVEVTVKRQGKSEKNFFNAIIDAKGKLLEVPQG